MQDRRWGIGSAAFRASARERYEDLIEQRGRAEDVSFRRSGRTLSTDRIVTEVCRTLGIEEAELKCYHRDSLIRPIAAKMLCKYGGLTQREVADLFGIKSGAAVSIQLKRLKETAANRPDVARLLGRLDRQLQKLP